MTKVKVTALTRNKAIGITNLFSPMMIAVALAQILRAVAGKKLRAKKASEIRGVIKIIKDAIAVAEEALGPVE